MVPHCTFFLADFSTTADRWLSSCMRAHMASKLKRYSVLRNSHITTFTPAFMGGHAVSGHNALEQDNARLSAPRKALGRSWQDAFARVGEIDLRTQAIRGSMLRPPHMSVQTHLAWECWTHRPRCETGDRHFAVFHQDGGAPGRLSAQIGWFLPLFRVVQDVAKSASQIVRPSTCCGDSILVPLCVSVEQNRA